MLAGPGYPCEPIKHLKALYCYHLDLGDRGEFGNLFPRGALLVIDRQVFTRGRDAAPQPPIRGRDAIRSHVARIYARCRNGASGPLAHHRTACSGRGQGDLGNGGDRQGARHSDRSAGHYRETCVFEDHAWRISSLHLPRTSIDVIEEGVLGGLKPDPPQNAPTRRAVSRR